MKVMATISFPKYLNGMVICISMPNENISFVHKEENPNITTVDNHISGKKSKEKLHGLKASKPIII